MHHRRRPERRCVGGGGEVSLRLVPVTLDVCKAFVSEEHRHHNPPTGWKWGVGVANGALCGVATAGRPVSRIIQKREPQTIEVNRTCTDGTRNANSMLYGAIWRAAKALGYTRAITYIQKGESGASLRAAGWVKVKDLPARKSWADSTANPELKAKRHPQGNGGVERELWEIRCATNAPPLSGESEHQCETKRCTNEGREI